MALRYPLSATLALLSHAISDPLHLWEFRRVARYLVAGTRTWIGWGGWNILESIGVEEFDLAGEHHTHRIIRGRTYWVFTFSYHKLILITNSWRYFNACLKLIFKCKLHHYHY